MTLVSQAKCFTSYQKIINIKLNSCNLCIMLKLFHFLLYYENVFKRNYCELADVKVPKRSQVSSASVSKERIDDSSSEKLCRLRIVDRDSENE